MLTRFAPAPTGWLHLGHVLNALEVWDAARARGGRVLLRIEDHDRQRARPIYEAAIREDLAWLGFIPDEEAPRQSERDEIYRATLSTFLERGLAYGCSCTRHDIAATSPSAGGTEARYPGTCRARARGLDEGLGWRVRMDPGVERFDDELCGSQAQDPAAQCGDLLVRDRLGNWTYQWAAAVDDHQQQVTHVIRGRDLLASTGRQIRLARLAGRMAPAVFRHHPLIMRTPAQKLSKSDGATGVRDLRAGGWSAEAVIAAARQAAVGAAG
jgi:glutamyl-tRNA synthetase/glutamyl-Q tRNA(Asp) synthetase